MLNVEALAGILGCKVSKLLMIYFGLPLGPAFKEKTLWNSVIEKKTVEFSDRENGMTTGWLEVHVPLKGRLSDAYKEQLIQPLNLLLILVSHSHGGC